MKFEEMHFNDKMKKSLKDLKYENATEVQEQSIPALIYGENVICKSFTGSGKTLAFGIGASERLLHGKSNGVLIVGPTRELVVQVRDEIHKLNRYTGLKVQVVYGGHGMNYEIQGIKKGVDILVATPGRLLDHIRQGVIKKDMFDMVILDEADRMLDMGFIEDIKQILDFVRPKNTHLFSATLDGSVAKIIHRYIPTYKEVIIKTEIVGTNIVEKNIDVRPQDKFLYLLELVKKAEGKKILVFVSTKRESENVERKLNKSGFYAASIHGDKSQRYREDALKDFKSGRAQILIATDVAARGLQIDNVEYVVNYDTARDKDTHKHRIGRTGRMGAKGVAVNFLTDDDKYKQERRSGRRPVRSSHSIDNKNVNVWDLANKSRGRFNNHRDSDRRSSFGRDRDHSDSRDQRDRSSRYRDNKDHFDQRKFDRDNKFDKKDSPEKSFDNSKREFSDKPRFGRSNDRKSFGDKPKFGRDKPRRDFNDGPRFGADRPRKSFGSDRKSKFDASDRSKGFESRTYQDKTSGFVPKSFRRDREYMSSRPEFKSNSFRDKSDDRPKRSFDRSDKKSFGKPRSFKPRDSSPKAFRGKKKFGNRH